MSKTVAIAGMGWLGKPFAQKLMMLGYRVKGSVTSIEKATDLQKKGFDVYPLEISETGITGEVNAFLSTIDYLVIMIPPGLRRNTGADYVLKMTHFLNEIGKSSLQNVILVSSTSVYDDSQGNVTEREIPRPTSESGRQLFQVEKLFFNNPSLNTSIVRFGGLYGGSRQPVRYLAGRENLNDGNAPVNLINRDDCIGILLNIIQKDALGHIFNAVSPQHPTKKEYYQAKAIELNLTPPTFSTNDEHEIFKKVDSKNVATILKYNFIHSL
jgi:nucleoside-diphosphate-sugar epimerase